MGSSAADFLLKKNSNFSNFNLVSDTVQEYITISDLELKIQTAILLDCELSFKSWLVLFVSKLASDGNQKKIKFLCDEYLGPRSGENWQPMILGKKKHEILQDVILPILSNGLQYQRLVNDYQEELRSLSYQESNENDTP